MHTTEQRRKWGLKGAINKWKNEVSPEERFWRNVDRRAPDDCWPWKRSRQKFGYGKASYKGVRDTAHRIVWKLTRGRIERGLWILHKCDNPWCCNPNHLFKGTRHDNIQDMIEKGRQRGAPVGHPYWGLIGNPAVCKLTEEDVRNVRQLCREGTHTQSQIAKMYGVGQDQISRIKNGKRRKHVK